MTSEKLENRAEDKIVRNCPRCLQEALNFIKYNPDIKKNIYKCSFCEEVVEVDSEIRR